MTTLEIVPIRGQSTWWIWAIRNEAGDLLDQSRTQFRSPVAAESEGTARLAALARGGDAANKAGGPWTDAAPS